MKPVVTMPLPRPRLVDEVAAGDGGDGFDLWVWAYDYERLTLEVLAMSSAARCSDSAPAFELNRADVEKLHSLLGDWLGQRLEPYVRGDGTVGKPRGGE